MVRLEKAMLSLSDLYEFFNQRGIIPQHILNCLEGLEKELTEIKEAEE